MIIQRTIPPVVAPVLGTQLWHGLVGICSGNQYLDRLATEIREYFGVRYVFFVSSGKAALYLILQALKSLCPKHQVVIPAYTCFSVPSAIVKAGLKVSLCDINSETFDFNHDLLKASINQDTLCVIPNHLFGISSDMKPIIEICKGRGVFVVEDAAQAMGGKYNGQMLGTIGDVGFFSLGRGKNITCGSGGIVITNSGQIADAVQKQYAALTHPTAMDTIAEFLRVVVMSILANPELYWLPVGLPFLKLGQTVFEKEFPVKRLSGMKAGLLYRWRESLECLNRIRTEMAGYYARELPIVPNHRFILPLLRFPLLAPSRETRDSIYSRSGQRGLGIGCMYPTAINEIEDLKSEFNGRRFPVARGFAKHLLTVPTHPFVRAADKKAICELIKRALTLQEAPMGDMAEKATREADHYH